MTTIPLVLSTAGAVSTSPTNIRSVLVQNVAAVNPGYTSNLPGTLIEDIASTDVPAIAMIDQSRVDAVNSITPYGANAFVLAQLGVQFGIAQGLPTNTSVYVIISGLAGYVIPAGFLVSDGTYQYSIQDGGAIETGGSTQPLYAVAVQSGSWAVPVGTVTQIVTSVPAGYTLTCTNATAGVAGNTAEGVSSYRSRVLQAGIAAGQGTPDYLTTQLLKVAGVSSRLVAIRQTTQGWEVICGGGDPYSVAAAIYMSVLDLTTIVGSSNPAINITVTLTNYPNSYSIVYVNPPLQTVTVAVIWNTTLINFTSAGQVNLLGAPAVQNYINSIQVGQPINIISMSTAFQTAVESILPAEYLTTLQFTVTINGVTVSPGAGTSIIASDSESYFYAAANGITVTQ
jgi:hypothetical protein